MNNIKHIFRTLFRYKLSTFVNIVSLFIAFWGIIILSLFISNEISYDNYHKDKDRIYMLGIGSDIFYFPTPIKKIIEKDNPLYEEISLFQEAYYNNIYTNRTTINKGIECRGAKIDLSFFKIFDFHFTEKNLVDIAKSVIISKSVANKLFGNTRALGKNINIGYSTNFTIIGVFDDYKNNTSFKYDYYIPYKWNFNDYKEWSYNLIIKLKQNNTAEGFNKFTSSNKEIIEYIKNLNERYGKEYNVKVLPLNKLHYTTASGQLPGNNKINIHIIYILEILVILLALMGAINFINCYTSQAPLRAKSIALKQIFGMKKWRSKYIILVEAIILSIIALIISLLIHLSFYTQIQNIFEINGLNINNNPLFYLIFLAGAIIFGIVAGIYPSFYITSPEPAQSVKGKMSFANKGKHIRSILVIIQLFFASLLIILTISIKKQLHFWNNFDTGLKTENIVYLHVPYEIQKHYEAFAKELLKNPNITDYTYTQFIPGNVGMRWGRAINNHQVSLVSWPVDERFMNFFNIKIVKGRNFRSLKSDERKYIINKKAVDKLGWDNPTNIKIFGFQKENPVIGVCEDFNFANLRIPIQPLILWLYNGRRQELLLKTNNCNYKKLFAFIRNTANEFDRDNNLIIDFLDNNLARQYKQEEKIGTFIQYVGIWTIILAITGLMGLIIFISRDRMKEISIRKVNGASIKEILKLLNNIYLKWLAIAFVLACPTGYLIVKEWLSFYTYKTEISWWIFALAGLILLFITVCTTSYINYKTASTNPINNLKDE
ncbi:ABC transporter permease [Marinilabiliaceae bacterium JC040]|nr:ABC transporter permease [Marinilabiliaceae bacterium JC040]